VHIKKKKKKKLRPFLAITLKLLPFPKYKKNFKKKKN
jgi:hypothetical protein